ncbi:thymidylate synthase [Aneurinibacillus aneurinilyticus]|jgi:thymidylate synthase|uniref:Thymidylate synthase n=2 Tax=Aneurinibacillus aneurinilyticus TaxID=1391 RepID=A0A848CNN0_ANEAE|nr:thymidylate synthase [Aneurinibacillus aneurinilyticus]ERI07491.1 thymidylate synthase [Aneurinibacillus aneurinilyticus ATCC 12856]MCI1692849.1 thymidylate synthase [Aneurinibacillus aneurinilyticus]MED0669672.1 thymidylate synthase [Aneurinibacillus aneurinilyticus]MED0709220.1 thymidylate synthase [Aneurinibacillus aneurinilyticus]MED0722010.1 thymidylate synthase [Aneurinibacillus aneurinilyticus]
MGMADIIYKNLVSDILENGDWDKDQQVRTRWEDGTPAYTKSVISKQITFDNSEVPILTTKRVAWKSAIHELLWFYVKRTSDCTYLDENNVTIWKEWTSANNNIGKAYGYQLGKPIMLKGKITNQVHHLLEELIANPASRRHVISLWNIDDLDQMALYPCVWNNQWLVKQGKLHLIVQIRSNDLALGNPFNVFQYYVLQRMVSQVTGYELGTLTFNINDLHIYERHIEPLQEQIQREAYAAPELRINPDVKNFDDFTIDDFELVNYQYHPAIKMEVAI